MSTALMTLAERVTFQLYDTTGQNLVGQTYTLQIQNVEPSQEQNDIDITNSESGGVAEWVPTIVIGSGTLDVVIDQTAFFALWAVPAAHVYVQMNLYFTKATLVALAAPLQWSAKVMIKSIKAMGKVDSGGSCWKANVAFKTIGRFTQSGSSLDGALAVGILSGF